jgi:formylglycine-generating enzyme required for sulfatase activity/serine/threonine protein kinase
MGFVFRAEDDGLQRPVALKVMRPEVAAEATAKERFLREGRAAAAIQSDHVITIYQVAEANGVPFLAMQYLDGLNLDQWLKNWQKTKNRPVQATAIVRVAKDLLKGLVAAHEKGLIHRDIKPANLWVEAKTSRIKLLDFGLAKTDGLDKGLTRSGQVLGTAAYMAPEQARGLRVDARADLFSVGVVLYRMIAGQSPFQQSTYNATIIAIATEEPPLAASFGVVPDDLAKLIDRMLAKSPDGRPASAKAALAVVLEVEQQLRSGSSAPSGVTAVPGAPVRPPEVRPAPDSGYVVVDQMELLESVEVVDGVEVVNPLTETTDRPIATHPVPRVSRPPLPRPPEPTWPSPTPRTRSSVRALPEEQKRDVPKKQTGRWVWYGVIATGIVAVLLIGVVALIVAKMRPDPGRPTSSNVGTDTASANSGGETTLPPLGRPKVVDAPQPMAPPSRDDRSDTASTKGGGETLPPVPGDLGKPVDGKTYTSKTTGMKFVRIKAGTFTMGSPMEEKDRNDDETPHEVTLTKDYFLGECEVTRGQFRKFVEADAYKTEAEADGKGGYGWDAAKKDWVQDPKYTWRDPGFAQTDEHPVVEVSWNDAVAFCEWLSRKEGKAYRLPTEAEWEYACRAGSRGRFHFGDDDEELAQYGNVADASFRAATGRTFGIQADDRFGFTAPVRQFKPNPWGLYDMHGNAWEWCQDYYGPYDKITSLNDPLQSTK